MFCTSIFENACSLLTFSKSKYPLHHGSCIYPEYFTHIDQIQNSDLLCHSKMCPCTMHPKVFRLHQNWTGKYLRLLIYPHIYFLLFILIIDCYSLGTNIGRVTADLKIEKRASEEKLVGTSLTVMLRT